MTKRNKIEIKKEQVIECLLNGYSYEEISQKLGISISKIKDLEENEINRHL